MKFCELEENVITLPKYENCFVYFLINKGEVVYVGQTTRGIYRPLSHRDKVYDEIKLIYCDEKYLDFIEDKFIQKYDPIYNKQRNYNVVWNLQKVKKSIQKQTGNNKFNLPQLKRILKELNISIKFDTYKNTSYITFDEYKIVSEYIKEQMQL